MATVTICSDFGVQDKRICHCFHCFPIYLPWSDGTGCHDLSFLNVEFQLSTFSPPSFTFIKGLFNSSSLSTITVVSSAYLRLLIFLLAILIPACASSSLAFFMMYSAYKLNKQGDNIQPWCTPFPIWKQSVVPCLVLTVASWPAYRFLRRKVSGLVFPSLDEFSSSLWSTQSKALVYSIKQEMFLWNWRREWKTTSAFLPWEPHEQYERIWHSYPYGRKNNWNVNGFYVLSRRIGWSFWKF